MALLFDENLPASLIWRLADLRPDCHQVVSAGLASSSDTLVWDYARTHGLTIISKDKDFHSRALVHGPPPQVVWLRLGNCDAFTVAKILRDNVSAIDALREDSSAAILIIDF